MDKLMEEGTRLDVLFTKISGLSREKSKAQIERGGVSVNGVVCVKASAKFPADCEITYEQPDNRFVGRGGYKLQKALDVYDIALAGKTCMDVGASTGGFTDCMLQAGAVKVYAVDAGTAQLHEKLRADSRVVVMENTNFRYMEIAEPVDFIAADLSFISLEKVMAKLAEAIKPGGCGVFLIKPQFEAGKGYFKHGVVKDLRIHKRVIENVKASAQDAGLKTVGIEKSPITGGDGNIEYLLYVKKDRGE